MPKTKKMRDHANELGARIGPTVDSARAKAAPLVAEARDRANPVLSDAKDRLSTDVLPAVAAAVAAAGAATEEVRGESMKRGKAVAAALKGEVDAPAPKRHRLRKLLVVLGLGGIVAFVAKKMSSREATTAWQSSYTPTPAAPGGAEGGAHRADEGAAEDADDLGGASPDVVAADAASSPHAATTPDNPAETIDVSKH